MVVSFGGVLGLTSSVGDQGHADQTSEGVSTRISSRFHLGGIFGSLASFLCPISGQLKKRLRDLQVDYLA